MPKFSLSAAFNLAKEKLQNSGCSEENCVGIIDGILDAELSGIKSHGFHYLPIYCNHLKIGKIKGTAKVSAENISDSALKVNADKLLHMLEPSDYIQFLFYRFLYTFTI